jgi:hypothetical protein
MKELFNILIKNNLTPNGYFLLYTMKKKISYNNYVNTTVELYKLKTLGFVEEKIENEYKNFYLTSKAESLLKELEVFEASDSKTKSKPEKISFSEWEENIVAFNNKFPKGKKPGTALSFKTTPKELFERFKWFFSEYPEYTWEDVMKATDRYVKTFEEQNDYSYMQLSKYFIKKDDKNKSTTSTLATVCFNIAEGDDEDIDTGFHYFGP